MAVYSAPRTAGQIVTVWDATGAKIANAPITIPTYAPSLKLNCGGNPVVSMGIIDLTALGTQCISYQSGNWDGTATPAGGAYTVSDSRTLILGDAIGATGMLGICYLARDDPKRY